MYAALRLCPVLCCMGRRGRGMRELICMKAEMSYMCLWVVERARPVLSLMMITQCHMRPHMLTKLCSPTHEHHPRLPSAPLTKV